MTPVNVPPALSEALAVAARLGVLDAAGEVLRHLVAGRKVDAARAAWRAARFAAARLAVERMR